MTLLDTSVLIDYVRGKDAKLAALLPTMAVAICGIVRAEMLGGARDAKHRASLQALLGAFQQTTIPDPLWEAIGGNLAALRIAGFTVPFSDVVIASLGIHLDIDVWARHQHYAHIKRVLPVLKLFQEPP